MGDSTVDLSYKSSGHGIVESTLVLFANAIVPRFVDVLSRASLS